MVLGLVSSASSCSQEGSNGLSVSLAFRAFTSLRHATPIDSALLMIKFRARFLAKAAKGFTESKPLTTWVASLFTKGVEELDDEFKVFIRISEAANAGTTEVHVTKIIIKSQPRNNPIDKIAEYCISFASFCPVIMNILGAIG
jgi:hypothetical protein